jgi:hypothetical protein
MKRSIAIGSIAIVACIVCCSWGFLGHRTIHQLAIYELPGGMQYFFHHNMNYLVKNSVRPDLRRNDDPLEAPKHFIDLEMYGDSAAWRMPLTWDAAVKKFGKDSLLKYGYVPYYIIIMKERLTNAFRGGNKDSILFYAADLAHYISDAHVPLHTSANYDGQLTGQKGLHSLWESTIPEIELDQYDLRTHHKAKYLKHPERAVWRAVRQSWSLLKDVFGQEKAVTALFTDSAKYRVQLRNGKEYKSYTSAFAKAYARQLGNTINQQLVRSANMVADFWYTSWVDAGCPDLNKAAQLQKNDKEKEQLQQEHDAFKHNQLIEKKLLIARQGKDSGE